MGEEFFIKLTDAVFFDPETFLTCDAILFR